MRRRVPGELFVHVGTGDCIGVFVVVDFSFDSLVDAASRQHCYFDGCTLFNGLFVDACGNDCPP